MLHWSGYLTFDSIKLLKYILKLKIPKDNFLNMYLLYRKHVLIGTTNVTMIQMQNGDEYRFK